MGMFDYVNVKIECPICGKTLKSFQSKDAKCVMNTIDPMYVDNFYNICFGCNSRIEFSRSYGRVVPTCRQTPFSEIEVEKMGFKMNIAPFKIISEEGE